jgi:beta-lactamase regulating signal transducer with metallopeptidase domain
VFSLVVPFITIEIIQEITTPIAQNNTIQINQNQESIVIVEETNYLPILLWSIYGSITFLLFFRFMKNISKIISKINSNKRIKYKNSTLVLLKETVLPHTFLNYIFISDIDYNNKKIETELFSHELTHVTQKHSLDILFIEALKTVFWFNPIFIFYKKAIQLNHEFLADEQVVNSYNNVPFYQNLLLSKVNQNQTYYLASNLNYSLTKKRLIMMTRNTSPLRALLKKGIIIPFILGIVYFLCFKTVAQESSLTAKKEVEKNESPTKDRRDEYYAGVRIIHKDCNKKTIVNKLYEELSPEEKDKFIHYVPEPFIEKSPTEKEFESFKDSKKYAIWLNGIHKPNTYLNNFKPTDIVFFQGSSVLKNARSKKFPQPFQYHFYTKDYFDKNLKNSWKKFGGKELINTVNCKDFWNKTNSFEQAVKEEKTTQVMEETLPQYSGGMEEFYKFFSKNYKIPSDYKGKGKIYISFMVDTDGSISEFEILRDLGFGTGEEAVRVLKTTPKWIPGKKDGKDVKTKFTLPITIQSK